MAGSSAEVTLRLGGALDREHVPEQHRALRQSLAAAGSGDVLLDLSAVKAMDSAGAALIAALLRESRARGRRLRLAGVSHVAKQALALLPAPGVAEKSAARAGLLLRTGEAASAAFAGLVQFLVLIADAVYFALVGLFRRRDRVRLETLAEQLFRVGAQAVGIVGLISFLVGLTLALQSAYQLRQFGANIFVANLVGVAMLREMGPLMTAIVLAGRSGASFAAEVATMTITEEIDALSTMGINPVRFVVVPKLYAMTIAQPLLAIMASACGIFGGFLVAITYLQLSPNAFIHQLIEVMVLKDLVTGLVKSVSFAWIITFVAAHKGFRVHGGAEGVGIATTASVVASIFLVIVADAFFSMVFYFGG